MSNVMLIDGGWSHFLDHCVCLEGALATGPVVWYLQRDDGLAWCLEQASSLAKLPWV